MAAIAFIPTGDVLDWINTVRSILDDHARDIAADAKFDEIVAELPVPWTRDEYLWERIRATAALLPPLPYLPAWVIESHFGIYPGEVSASLTGVPFRVVGLQLTVCAEISITLDEDLPLIEFHPPALDIRPISADDMQQTFEDWLGQASPVNLIELGDALQQASPVLQSALAEHEALRPAGWLADGT